MRHYGALPPPDAGDPEDCGAFCVWWYGIIRRRVRTVEWAYAWRSDCGSYWHKSSCVSGFKTREDAVSAARAAAREAVTQWEVYGECFVCGVDAGRPCVGIGASNSVLWPPTIKRPHRGRAVRAAARKG